MKFGIRAHDISDKFDIENICKSCAQNKIDCLQLVLEKAIDSFEPGRFSTEYARSIKSRLGGTEIAVLGSYINPSERDEQALEADLNKFKEKIKYADIIKPLAVGTETGVYKNDNGETDNDSEEAYQHLLKSFEKLVPEAEKYGVNIAIEGVHCFVINSPKKLKRLVDDLHSENVKVIFDPVNYITYENHKNQDEMINDMFDMLGEKIVAIHIKDYVFEGTTLEAVPIGEGMMNYRLILDRLNEKNINVPLISEGMELEKALRGIEYLKNMFVQCH